MKTIHINDYRSLFDGEDATPAVRAALLACKEDAGATLCLDGETLHFWAKHTYKKDYYISNNDYSEKSIVFPLIGFDGITVDGAGARLDFHGEVNPFVIDGSRGVTLKNFSIDYPHPYFFEAEIVSAAEDLLEITFDEMQCAMRVDDKRMMLSSAADGWSVSMDRFLVCEFDRDTTAPSAYIRPYFLYLPKESDGWFLDRMYRYVRGEQIDVNRVRFHGHFGHTHTVGNKLIGTCGPGRRCPAIFANRSDNLLLREVTLYASASMGVICQLCENVTLDTVRAIPNREKGRSLSVNADATHFVACTGAIRLEHCTFTNMLDDAVNVHGNYLKIVKALDSHTLLLTYGHEQQRGVNVFDAGDRVCIVSPSDMRELKTLTVAAAESLSAEQVRLTLLEDVSDVEVGCCVENLTKYPEIYMNGCVCGFNRPRGILPQSRRHTEITDNTFYNMNAAIHFTGDCNSWFESGPVSDVTVRGNRFENSAYTGGAVVLVDPHVLEGDLPYHGSIVIEDNDFELCDARFLKARYVSGLVFRNNRFKRNDTLPSHEPIGERGIDVQDCPDATVEDVCEV